ncbi:MAG TPA: DinB family protein [Terriglobales bacterium]|nr:DinB family protein [Terriglobales bacterium]
MSSPEPWLRGTETGVPAVVRAVLHALQLANEDIKKWCGHLSDAELNERPSGVAPVAFHVRHIARSLDRLLTYAEGGSLNDQQMAQLKAELDPAATRSELLSEFENAIANADRRVRDLAKTDLEETRTVGKKLLPTTVGGLLVHVADHTQRHVGQAVTTAKIVRGEIVRGKTA